MLNAHAEDSISPQRRPWALRLRVLFEFELDNWRARGRASGDTLKLQSDWSVFFSHFCRICFSLRFCLVFAKVKTQLLTTTNEFVTRQFRGKDPSESRLEAFFIQCFNILSPALQPKNVFMYAPPSRMPREYQPLTFLQH